jgi:hypothetical protein
MLNSLTKAVSFVMLTMTSIASFAQTVQPASHTQVISELANLEQAGYDPNDAVHYPENMEAAEEKVAAKDATANQWAASSNDGSFKSASHSQGIQGF